MSETLKFGNGQWATKVGSTLAYNDENGNFKPLPFNFTRSTSGTRVNKDGLIEVVTNNKPRIDFLNDSNGALLLEPSRTNLLPYSVDYSQADWAKSNVTLTSNFATAPDGTTSASKIVATASDGSLQDSISITSGTTYTFSVYLKTTSGTLNTNISLGSPAFPDTEGDGGRTKQIIVTNTWQRFTITSTADATANSGIGVGGFNSFSTGEEVLVWGAQLEVGSYATSYIPTQGATATRVVETCIQTPPSGIIGQTEGTMYCEIDVKSGYDVNNLILTLSDGTANNFMYINRSNGKLEVYIKTSGVAQLSYLSASILSVGIHKLSLSYKLNDFVLYLDGVLMHSDTSGTVPSCNKINVGSYYNESLPFNNRIKDVKLYNTRLTNEELAALTTI
jgi:hypothetical protein